MTPAEFVEIFEVGWKESKPDGFLAFFGRLSHPDVIATQPLLPTAVGPAAYMRSFENTFRLMPDMSAEVLGYGGSDDDVYVESMVRATVGGRPTEFHVVDHFQLRDQLIYRRDAFFNPQPIVISVLLRPWVLPAVARAMRG
jgi:hypothetical protein